ncbi:MAG: D-alanyl-D-alanine carboxypeptidase/D-alanyl-D-alanine-endopeptidase [Gammaproteobacteria bacterium]
MSLTLFTTVYAADLPAMRALQAQGYNVAGLVVDLQTGEKIAEYDAEKILTPASITKIYTAALALQTWGPDYRFETELLYTGQRAGSRLEGDLILRGSGDATLTNEGLWRLALDVARSGIQVVTGKVIVDESRFGRVKCVTVDRCKAEDKSWRSYDALITAAPVNHGNVAVMVTPGSQIGQAANISIDPYPLDHFVIEGNITTVAGRGAEFNVSRYTDDHSERLRVSGKIGVGAGSQRVYRSVGKAAEYTGELFKRFLKAADVTVESGTMINTVTPVRGTRLATLPSQTLGRAVSDMLYYSNNMLADTLTLNLLVELQNAQPANMLAAGNILETYARELTQRSSLTNNPSQARIFDGSGLNPDNKLAPVDLVAMLQAVYHRTEDFPFLLGSLRVPLHSPARGLSGSHEVWKRLALKTGGLSEPVSVHTIAGYMRLRNGNWGAFAMLVNGRPGKPIYRVKAFEAIRKDLERL